MSGWLRRPPTSRRTWRVTETKEARAARTAKARLKDRLDILDILLKKRGLGRMQSTKPTQLDHMGERNHVILVPESKLLAWIRYLAPRSNETVWKEGRD